MYQIMNVGIQKTARLDCPRCFVGEARRRMPTSRDLIVSHESILRVTFSVHIVLNLSPAAVRSDQLPDHHGKSHLLSRPGFKVPETLPDWTA